MGRYNDGDNRGLVLRIKADETLDYFHTVRGGAEGGILFNQITTAGTFNDGLWHQACIRFTLGTGSELFVDGVTQGTDTTRTDAIPSFALDFLIGRQDFNDPSRNFTGSIDDVIIFNRSLSVEQIKLLNDSIVNVLASNETSFGETWFVNVTVNDGIVDSTSVISNNVTILAAVVQANITVVKGANVSFADVGEDVLFQINLTNVGGLTALNVTVTDILSPNLTFISSQPTPNDTNLTFIIESIAAGITFNLNITINISNTTIINGTTIRNFVNTTFRNSTNGVIFANNATFNLTVNASNRLPTIAQVILNSSLAGNVTTENLTAFFINVTDGDGDAVKNITNWFVNGTSIQHANLPFDGGSNSTFTKDYSPFANKGIVTSATFNSTGGYDGFGAYSFDGVNDQINLASDPSLNFGTKDFTWTFYMKSRGTANLEQGLISKKVTAPTNGEYFIRTSTGGGLRLIYYRAGGNDRIEQTPTDITDQQWHHIAVSKNSTNVTIYIDGQFEDGFKFDAEMSETQNIDVEIGTSQTNGGANLRFNGTIDEVSVWNRSLTATQIKALYENKTNIITSTETGIGETWFVNVTVNDGIVDSTSVISNNVTIIAALVEANITVVKGANVSFADVGDDVLFQINLTNIGVLTATNVTVTDILSPNLTFKSSQPPPNDTNLTFIIDSIAAGITFNINITLNISNTTIINGTVIRNFVNTTFRNSTNGILFANNATFNLTANVSNRAPTIDQIILNSTLNTNLTTENLTAFFINATDLDGNAVKNVTNWFLNGKPIKVLNLPFEAGSTNAATRDFTIFRNDAVVSGALYNQTRGRDGFGAYTFDGVNDFINVSDDNTLDITGAITVSVWIYPRDLNQFRTILAKGIAYSGVANFDRAAYFLGVSAANTINLQIIDDGEAVDDLVRTTGQIPLNTWTHIVATWDGTDDVANNMKIYVNGQLNSTATNVDVDVINSIVEPLGIGMDLERNDAQFHWKGSLDDMRIYNRSLSADQIRIIFEQGEDRILAANETSVNDVWFVNVTPNDGTADGNSVISNNVTILNSVPTIDQVILNSSLAGNTTTENLTANFINVSDVDGNAVKNITNFFVNGTSFASLNMPFEATGSQTTTAKDYSSDENDGTVTGATYNSTGGQDNFGAYEFDGINDRISLSNSLTRNQGTIMHWVKPRSVDRQVMIYYESDGTTGGTYNGFGSGNDILEIHTAIRGDVKYAAVYQDGTGATGFIEIKGGTAIIGQYQHVAMTWDRSENLSLFVDGVRVNSTDISGLTFTDNTPTEHFIGRPGDGTANRHWNGTIDEVLVFNRTLTEAQIKAIYENKTNIIVSEETVVGDTWFVNVTVNDGIVDSTSVISNNVTILNSEPTIDQVILNSTNPSTNDTTQNLTAHPINVTDVDGNIFTLNYNWFVNGTSITVLNMPMTDPDASGGTDIVDDFSSNNNDGVLGAAADGDAAEPTFQPTGGPDQGGAYKFDGINDRIEIDSSATTRITGDLTLEAWIKFDSHAGTSQIFQHAASGETEAANVLYSIRVLSTGDLNILHEFDGGSDISVTFDTNLSTGRFYHIVYVRNTTSKQHSVYINGTAEDSPKAYGDNPTGGNSGGANLFLGTFLTAGFPFNGTYAHAAVYNRELSPEQIKANYNSGIPRMNITVSQETGLGEKWNTQVVLIDNLGINRSILTSNNVTILNTAPSLVQVVLNSTLNTNLTSENLTAFFLNVSDVDGNGVKNITNWFVNGTSITLLNLPFEGGSTSGVPATNGTTRDYSPHANNAAVVNATFNSTGGYDGFGAYEFDGESTRLQIADSDSLSFGNSVKDNPFSITVWVKMRDATRFRILSKANFSIGTQRE